MKTAFRRNKKLEQTRRVYDTAAVHNIIFYSVKAFKCIK